MLQLILYSKPGCHLCEGLAEKLAQVDSPRFELTVRDITTREDWFQRYQFEIPVLCQVGAAAQELPLPRLSPRTSVAQVAQMLQKYCQEDTAE